jgi:CAAX prenyl protease-like protein
VKKKPPGSAAASAAQVGALADRLGCLAKAPKTARGARAVQEAERTPEGRANRQASIMNFLRQRLAASPAAARVVPFVLFAAVTVGQGKFGEASRYWFYFAKTIMGAWLIWLVRPLVPEMKWKFSWSAVVGGIGVFVMWVGIDGFYPPLDRLLGQVGLARAKSEAESVLAAWNPTAHYGRDSALAWMFVVARAIGSSIVVPPLEEVFYRSFAYRYFIQAEFQSVSLGQFRWTSFLMTAALFGVAHQQWLAGILCGFAYQALVCWKKRLGDAMTAHAITNFLLALWVVWRGAWHFW